MRVLLLQLGLVALLAIGGTAAAIQAGRATESGHAAAETLALAQTVASSPGIAAAVTGPHPTAELEPITLRIQHQTGVDFVVVMSPAGIRYTHPNPKEIGKHYLGHIEPAVHGHPFTETYTGTLGPSVRSVAPIYGPRHRIVGLVSIGITIKQLSAAAHREIPLFVALAAGAFAAAGLGSWAVARRLRRQTLGLGPQELTRVYEHHDAVLHAMTEGLLVLDTQRRVALANDEAIRLLGCDANPAGQPAGSLGVDPALAGLLNSGRETRDETHLAGDRILAVSQSVARRNGRVLGTVTTLRDHTDLRALAGELDSARGFASALSASAHEAANRLHTVVTLIELDRPAEAIRFATAELATSQQLTDRLLATVGDTALAALLLGKISQAAEHGVEVTVSDDSATAELPFETSDLITIAGNLIDNAIEAALAGVPPRRVSVTVKATDGALQLRVADSGPGIDPEQAENLFAWGWTTKNEAGHGLGLALVRQRSSRHGGTIEVTRDARLGGAAICVRLPLTPQGARDAEDPPAPGPPAEGPAAGLLEGAR
jgi:two-component system, CitB family, sensor kinase